MSQRRRKPVVSVTLCASGWPHHGPTGMHAALVPPPLNFCAKLDAMTTCGPHRQADFVKRSGRART